MLCSGTCLLQLLVTMADALPALPANPVVMNLQPVYGVALIGVLFSSALWGISCMQL